LLGEANEREIRGGQSRAGARGSGLGFLLRARALRRNAAVTTPRLTVITPSVNQAQYLERTLQPLLDQEDPDLEDIVMDGGSTDGSFEILKRYDDRLSYWVSEPDEGQSWAINRGIERATGDVVAYINSDDFYLPGAFDASLALFEDPSVRWVAGATEY